METVDPKDSEAVVLYVHGEWAGFYIGGALRNHGDKDNMIEQLLEHLGVDTRYSNAFLRGTGISAECVPVGDRFVAARWPSREELRRRFGQALAQRNALLGQAIRLKQETSASMLQ